MSFSNREEEALFKNVVDIMMMKKPEQRALGYEKMLGQLKIADERVKTLLEERPHDVTKTISYFTSIVQRIKDSKEKLISLKKRLLNCKSTFSETFDKAEQASRSYLKSKETVKLMQKIIRLSESINVIETCISDKSFLSASKHVAEIINDIDNELSNIDAIKNWKIDFNSTIFKLYNVMMLDLTEILNDNKELEVDQTSLKIMSDHDFMPNLPLPCNVNLLQNTYSSSRDRIKIIIQSLSHIKKLKAAILYIVERIKTDARNIISDTTKLISKEMTENFEIFRIQDECRKVNRPIFVALVKRVILRLDIIFDKYDWLYTCFKEEFENCGKTASGRIEENLPIECTPDLILEHSNKEINIALRTLLKHYLTDKDVLITQQLDHTANTLNLSIMDQVFSLKRRNFESPSKNYLYQFDTSSSTLSKNTSNPSANISSTVDDWYSNVDTLCKPSVKYLKGIYLSIFTFILKHNELYSVHQTENPLRSYLDEYFNETYKSYFFKKFSHIFTINIKEPIENYGNVSDQDLKLIARKRPLHKAAFDFALFIRSIMSNITVFSPNISFFLDYFFKIGQYIFMSYEATLDIIAINQNGITIKGFQMTKEFVENDINKLYDICCLCSSQKTNFDSASDSFLNNIAFSLASSLKNIKLIKEHILLDGNSQISLISLYENQKWLYFILHQFFEYCKTICSSQPFNYIPINKIIQRFKPIEIPSVLRENIEDYLNPKILENIKQFNRDIFESSKKCYIILYFDLRFRVAFRFQHIFKKLTNYDNLSPDFADSLIEVVYKDIISSYNIYKLIVSNKRLRFLFYNLDGFIKNYLILHLQDMQSFKIKYAFFLRQCLYSLVSHLSTYELIPINNLLECAKFFELFDQTPNEIIEYIKVKGPQFSLDDYISAISMLEDSTETKDIFNDRIHLLKSYFNKEENNT